MNKPISPTDISTVRSKMIVVRGQTAMLDRDVAELYGVETKHVNQAVRNNPGRFPDGYVFVLDAVETNSLRSKILTLDAEGGRGHHSNKQAKVTAKRIWRLCH